MGWHPRDWPLAAKAIALGAASWVLLAAVLTSINYVHAMQGLRSQAEGALGADGQLVASALDDFHRLNLDAVVGLANLPIFQRAMSEGIRTSGRDIDVANQLLASTSRAHAGTTSIAVMDLNGLFAFSSDKADFNLRSGLTRDFFVQAFEHDSFVSGVQGSAEQADAGHI